MSNGVMIKDIPGALIPMQQSLIGDNLRYGYQKAIDTHGKVAITMDREKLIKYISKELFGFEEAWEAIPEIMKNESMINIDKFSDALNKALPQLLVAVKTKGTICPEK